MEKASLGAAYAQAHHICYFVISEEEEGKCRMITCLANWRFLFGVFSSVFGTMRNSSMWNKTTFCVPMLLISFFFPELGGFFCDLCRLFLVMSLLWAFHAYGKGSVEALLTTFSILKNSKPNQTTNQPALNPNSFKNSISYWPSGKLEPNLEFTPCFCTLWTTVQIHLKNCNANLRLLSVAHCVDVVNELWCVVCSGGSSFFNLLFSFQFCGISRSFWWTPHYHKVPNTVLKNKI